MDDYEKEIFELADKLTEIEINKPKTIIGVIDLIHNLVEETARRHKKKEKLSEEFKKELTLRSIKTVVEILKEKELIDIKIADFILSEFVEENLNLFLEIIEDLVEIYNSELIQGCLCCKKKKNIKMEQLKKLK